MFQGFGEGLIPFFLKVRFDNRPDFLRENRAEYTACVQQPFYAFIDALAPAMLSIDGEMEVRPAKCLARLRRDTRFTRDKSPFRDHLWVQFHKAAEPREGSVFYWFEITPERCNWGLGVWGENKTRMEALRRRMQARPRELLRILPVLAERHFALGGEQYKRLTVPPGLPFALAPWYTAKSLYVEKQGIPLSRIYSPAIADDVARDFTALSTLYHYLCGTHQDGGNPS